jgi:hypothetical protein
MGTASPNPVTSLPYTLVEVDEPKKPLRQRVEEADSLQWKLWLAKYAWILSMLTMAPGIALASYILTRDAVFSVAITATAVGAAAGVFYRRVQGLP